jgi:O-antigen ligase
MVLNRAAAKLILQSPVFGVGPMDTSFLTIAMSHNVTPEVQIRGFEGGQAPVDNAFVAELGCTGLLGFIPYTLLFYLAFKSSQAGRRFEEAISQEANTSLRYALLGACLAMVWYSSIGEKLPWILIGFGLSGWAGRHWAVGRVGSDRRLRVNAVAVNECSEGSFNTVLES